LILAALCVAVMIPDVARADADADADIDIDAGFYAAMGLSIGNRGDASFGETTYPSAEVGVMRGAGSLALVVGRADNDFSEDEELSDYWWEVKVALSAPVGTFGIYGLLGIGNYLGTSQQFIEYGVGMSRSWDSLSVFAQASNWDGVWYVTPGIMYSF